MIRQTFPFTTIGLLMAACAIPGAWEAQSQIAIPPSSVFSSTATRGTGEWLFDNAGVPSAGDDADRHQVVAFTFFDLAPYGSLLPEATGLSLNLHLDSVDGHPNQLQIDWMGYFGAPAYGGSTKLINIQAAGFPTELTQGSAPGTYAIDLTAMLPLAASAPEGQEVLGFRFQQSFRENGNYEPDHFTFSSGVAELNLAAVPEPSQITTFVGLGVLSIRFLSRRRVASAQPGHAKRNRKG